MSLNTTEQAGEENSRLDLTMIAALPPELLLMIIGDTSLLELVPIICALWMSLRSRGMIRQDMPMDERRAMERVVSQGAPGGPPNGQQDHNTNGLGAMPLELLVIVAESLSCEDRISFAIATWPILYSPSG